MSDRYSLNNAKLLVGIAVAVLTGIGIVRAWVLDPDPPAELQMVSTRMIEAPEGDGPAIDILVRNSGGEVAFVSDVEVRILDYSQAAYSGQVQSSGTYAVTLPGGLEVSDLPVAYQVSQAVDGGEADRFTLTVGLEEGVAGLHMYGAVVRLLYNEGRTTVWSDTLRFRLSN